MPLMSTETSFSFALEVTSQAWQPTGFYLCPLCGKQEAVNDFISCPRRRKTADVRDNLKRAITNLDLQLRNGRVRTRKSDSAARQRLNRLEHTLTAYKRTLRQVEKSAETLAKAEFALKGWPPTAG